MQRRLHRFAIITASLLLAGCGWGDSDARRVIVIGDATAPLAGGARPSDATGLVRAATDEGLVSRDAEGRVIPGLADRWIVTDGGLAYIFRLRDGRWADGEAVSGESAAAAMRQALSAVARTPLGLDLAGVGEVRAMAGRVIEIRLTRAMPDLLQLLAQPELGLTHHDRGWGPMELKRHGTTTRLVAVSPERRGLAADDPAADALLPLRIAVMPAARAIAAFARGEADVVLDGRFADLPLISRATPGASALRRVTPRFDPVIGLFGLVVARADGLLATADGREALAMAIDRDALASALGASGWLPTSRIIAPGTDGDPGIVGERWTDIALDGRRILAQRRIAQFTAASGVAPVVRIALPQGPGADMLFARLAGDFATVGVTAKRVASGEPADLRLIDSVARYPRAAWFLDQLSCLALHGPCSAEADTAAAQARAMPDQTTPAAATQWAIAEQTLTASNIYMPLGSPIRWSLARGSDSGFVVNRWGFHPLTALANRPN